MDEATTSEYIQEFERPFTNLKQLFVGVE